MSDPVAPPSAAEVFIPYRNAAALTAYYLGIFSLLLGFFLGIPAIVLGIMGLSKANREPRARGKAHAWTGIILGTLTTIASFVFFAALVIGMLHH